MVNSAYFFQKMQNAKESDLKLRPKICHLLLFLDQPTFELTGWDYPPWSMARLSPFGVVTTVVTNVTSVDPDQQAKIVCCGLEGALIFGSKIDRPYVTDSLPCMCGSEPLIGF